jgi:hypothetical protein
MRLISIDPGAHSGMAVFQDGLLIEAHAAVFDKPLTWYRGWADEIVVEEPYGTDGGRASFSDLAELLKRACEMALTVSWRTNPKAPIRWVRPQTWKGSVDKQITYDRMIAALSEAERNRFLLVKYPKSYLYNVSDSVAIGLWTMGRYR